MHIVINRYANILGIDLPLTQTIMTRISTDVSQNFEMTDLVLAHTLHYIFHTLGPLLSAFPTLNRVGFPQS